MSMGLHVRVRLSIIRFAVNHHVVGLIVVLPLLGEER